MSRSLSVTADRFFGFDGIALNAADNARSRGTVTDRAAAENAVVAMLRRDSTIAKKKSKKINNNNKSVTIL